MSLGPLQVVQLGEESVFGTPVTQTVQLMGISECTLTPGIESIMHEEMRGSLQPGFNAQVNKIAGGASLSGLVTYEDLPYWLNSILATDAAPSGSDPYIYEYAMHTAQSEPTRSFYTMAYGDGDDCKALESAYCTELVISGESNGEIEFSSEWLGEEVVDDDLDALSSRSVTVAMGHDVELYIDAVGGTIGTTQITSPNFSFELAIRNGLSQKFALGSQKPLAMYSGRHEVELTIGIELDATTRAYLDSILGGTLLQHQVRVGLARDASNDVTFDVGGALLNSEDYMSEVDGVLTYDFVYAGIYNSTLTNSLLIDCTNSVASLP